LARKLAKKHGGDFEVGTELFSRVFEFSATKNSKLQAAWKVQSSAFSSREVWFFCNPVVVDNC
jgi:hypothetical protein